MFESLWLPFLAFKVHLQEAFWQWKVKKNYYHHSLFQEGDRALLRHYRIISPYHISKNFMQEKGAINVHVYGETPLKVYNQMAKRWDFQKGHRFVELGCGRGRGLFFLSSFYGCECIGIEWIREFVEISRSCYPSLQLYHEDFMTSTQVYGDFLYLYGTCLNEEEIVNLCEKFLKLPKECKIITTSFALCAYHEKFKVVDEFKVRFPWGRGSLFLNQIGESE